VTEVTGLIKSLKLFINRRKFKIVTTNTFYNYFHPIKTLTGAQLKVTKAIIRFSLSQQYIELGNHVYLAKS